MTGGGQPVEGSGELGGRGGARAGSELSELLEDSVEDLYEHAPCGYLSTLLDGTIVKLNATLSGWLGFDRDVLVGNTTFAELLTVGGRLYHETHIAPLLRLQGEVRGIALELRTGDGGRLPVLVTAVVKNGTDGEPRLIRTTVFDARDRRAYEQELLRARQQADHERERLQRLAGILQRSLLPPTLTAVPGLQVAAHYRIASLDQVGGDFYDLFPLADGVWGFFLGDVCGKGATAAAVTSLTRYTMRAAFVYNPDPVAVLGNLNSVLLQEHGDRSPRYCTAIVGLITPEADGSCTVTMASGGHPPALLLRADGAADFQNTPGGQLIGILPDARFAAVTLRLDRGDTLLLYTDGLTEARTAGGDRYSPEALHSFATGLAPVSAGEAVTAVAGLLDRFGAGLDDDAALLVFGVPAARPAAAPRS